MKLVSADFHKQDIDNLKDWIALLQRKDKTMTMKKYVRFCVVHMTNTLMESHRKDMEAAKVAASEEEKK